MEGRKRVDGEGRGTEGRGEREEKTGKGEKVGKERRKGRIVGERERREGGTTSKEVYTGWLEVTPY